MQSPSSRTWPWALIHGPGRKPGRRADSVGSGRPNGRMLCARAGSAAGAGANRSGTPGDRGRMRIWPRCVVERKPADRVASRAGCQALFLRRPTGTSGTGSPGIKTGATSIQRRIAKGPAARPTAVGGQFLVDMDRGIRPVTCRTCLGTAAPRIVARAWATAVTVRLTQALGGGGEPDWHSWTGRGMSGAGVRPTRRNRPFFLGPGTVEELAGPARPGGRPREARRRRGARQDRGGREVQLSPGFRPVPEVATACTAQGPWSEPQVPWPGWRGSWPA